MYINNKRTCYAAYLGILILSIFNTACKKTYNDLIDGQGVDERLAGALKDYQSLLVSAPYGWKFLQRSSMAYNGGQSDSIVNTFTYYMTFDSLNTVTMYSDFDTTQARVPMASTYRLKALQRPSLIFDTRGYIHYPSDPDPGISNSPLGGGQGWGTDFEFAFADNVSASKLGDTIHLKGIYNQADAYMVKATKADQDLYISGQYAANLRNIYLINKIPTYWRRITVNNIIYELSVPDFVSKTISIGWLDASGNMQKVLKNFHFGFDGSFAFNTPIANGSTNFAGFSNFSFDNTNAHVTVLGINENGTITPATKPLKIDLTAPQRWIDQMQINFNQCWVSEKAFHANGVDDYCGLTQVKGYVNLWYAGAAVFGAGSEGVAAFMNDPDDPAPLSPPFLPSYPLFKADSSTGKGTFSPFLLYYYFLSPPPPTPKGIAMGKAFRLLYGIPAGPGSYSSSHEDWYFVQMDDKGKAYDMVRASDATTWISWHAR